MLRLTVKGAEQWDAKREEFVYTKPTEIALEHSLVSVSKWEARWGRSYLSKPPETRAEEIDYIRCMTITQNVPPEAYNTISQADLNKVRQYIESPMTATTFNDRRQASGARTIVTSELIYYWMISFGIPFECQKWHLNRLLTLIRICEIKSRDPKKQNQGDILRNNAALNAKRRAAMHSRG